MRKLLAVLLVVGVGVAGSEQQAHAACPDGVLDAAEECDDGGVQPGDGCSATCTIEPWILAVCSTARDGSRMLIGATTLNTYFAAPAVETVLVAGTRVLALGAQAGVNVPVRAGDRLMVIQMQGALVDAGAAINAGGPYGDGAGGNDRAGAIANSVQAGIYELVVAVTDAAGGMVAIRGAGPNGGLVNPYVNSRVVGAAQGFQTYQVIRIPQLDNLTLTGAGTVTAAAWNGATGGVAVIDVFGVLTFNGGGIDASGRGFRGGRAVTSANGAFDTAGFPGHKGEGIAGSPRLLFSSVTNLLVTGTLGYPTPADEGPGAPGNAGGGSRQSDDSAGGGGGNGGAGGVGGRGGGANAPGRGNSGRGGAPYHGPGVIQLGAQQASMGGGGGGASGDDAFPTDARPGSGRNGGGVVIVRAAAITVMGAGGRVLANGDANVTAAAEGGGGGGAGGTVVLYTYGSSLTTLAVDARGGAGNNMQLADDGGGGGGGGLVYRIATVGGTINVTGGAGGTATTGGDFNGLAGAAGVSDSAMMAPPNLACEFDRDTDLDGVLDGDDLCPGSDDRDDHDGDSIPDVCDLDDDNDGIPDLAESGGVDPSLDGDGDLISDFEDRDAPGFVDANADGIDDRYDLDGDGVPNHQDLDADGDGLLDLLEGGGTDANHDGMVDGFTDTNGDGLDDDAAGQPLPLPDHDGDGRPDFLDVDDDGDGVLTVFEAPDADANGSPDDAQDTDGDGTPDYLDVDDDGDGLPTVFESPDADRNGDPADAQDSDGDGIPDYLDADDDGDGQDTGEEQPDPDGNGNPDDAQDSDGDGIPDYLDPDRPDRFGYAGGACGATGTDGAATWFLLLAVIGALAARRRRTAILAVLVAAIGSPAAVRAEIDLDRYAAPAYVDDGLVLSRPAYPGHLVGGVSLHLEYANDPLVVETMLGDKDSETIAVVSNHLVGHLGGSVGLGRRALVFAGLPVHLAMNGDSPMNGIGADGAGVGDPAIGLRHGLVRSPRFGLAAEAAITLPLATAADSGGNFAGSSTATFAPSLLAELGRPRSVRFNFAVGLRLRKEAPLENVKNGSELTFGAGVAFPLYTTARTAITGHAELHGATGLAAFGSREESPIELLLGAKSRLRSGLSFGLAAGPGIQRGIGAPDYRLLAMLGWAMPGEARSDRPRVADIDGDGVLDSVDQCLLEPEDKDAFEDADGCADPDNDQDLVPDVADGAPLEPEDRDGFQDDDGVPDPDNDLDGVADANDKCILEPEDRDAFEDDDGCPDLDNDRDTVADTLDECPTAPGKPENKGCPVAVRMDNQAGRILMLKRVEFATSSDVILMRSYPILDEVAATIAANPQLKRLRVEGHTDSDGPDAYNMDLSRRRAKSVMKWLIQIPKIDAARLEAAGCGENVPISSNKTFLGKQENRRVEFFITDPAPAAGDVNDLSKCLPAK